ncbi:MAG: alpha/beta hydrolase [Casimicrobiaceae bacterium]
MTVSPSMRRRVLQALSAGATSLVAACSPLGVLNGIATADGSHRVGSRPYGDHPRQVLDVYAPHDGGASPAPVIVFFYGGNWNSGDRRDYRFIGEALAGRGFVVVIPDYRLYPEVRFPAFLQDGARAVRWTIDHIGEWGGDPRRVVLMGHSAGAYNAAMLAFDRQWLAGAGVAPGTIRALVGLAGPYDFLPLQSSITRGVFGYPDTPLSTQPIQFATAAAPPSLLVTGANDGVVDPGNSSRLAAALRTHGANATVITYPGLGHRLLVGALATPLGFLAPVLEDVATFVNARTGAAPSRRADHARQAP